MKIEKKHLMQFVECLAVVIMSAVASAVLSTIVQSATGVYLLTYFSGIVRVIFTLLIEIAFILLFSRLAFNFSRDDVPFLTAALVLMTIAISAFLVIAAYLSGSAEAIYMANNILSATYLTNMAISIFYSAFIFYGLLFLFLPEHSAIEEKTKHEAVKKDEKKKQ